MQKAPPNHVCAAQRGSYEWTGLPRRESPALGVLLNTRGLIELMVLQIGHEAHLIDGRLLALLTGGGLLTTLMTAPLLKLTGHTPDSRSGGARATEGQDSPGARAPTRVQRSPRNSPQGLARHRSD
ncbi:hypothetical protein SCWH03_27880 [Streptomyces pacificus]|uniref:Cation/H+ exchanger domain-containing protein n=1 Tax=Streptomyces pacificus TaxID=2705029 RepID=A0A6A0AUA9_9ACTN|nr:hypothetical protein SCWH03_27880 [Streptomyces pacificus]